MNAQRYLFALLVLFAGAISQPATAQPSLTLTEFASGLDRPIGIEQVGDERLFIVEQDGIIKIVDLDGTVHPTPFLDFTNKVYFGQSEQGFLGLAFHPDYKQNGYFFTYYTYGNGDSRISRWTVSSDPNVADPNSEVVLIEEDQPAWNHNGGQIAFGPDGYLYVGLGDGGGGGDTYLNGQNRQALLGKILRIDVGSSDSYAIPADNPFVGDPSTLDEIWTLGIRNPWRFSWDRKTGDLWIADVGQDDWEEIDMEPAGSPGGLNYGWNCREAFHAGPGTGCGPLSDYADPVFEYPQIGNDGSSVTGGFVYRGGLNVDMMGYYFCADYVVGEWYAVEPDGLGGFTGTELTETTSRVSSFGEDMYGELYVARLGGDNKIYKLSGADQSGMTISGTATDASQASPNGGSVDLVVTGGTAPYDFVWSNGSTIEDLLNVSGGNYKVTVTDAAGLEAIANFSLKGAPVAVENQIPVAFNITVFPNPAKDAVQIQVHGINNVEKLVITNAFGQVVDTKALNGSNTLDLDTRNYAPGTYMVSAERKGANVTKKFMVVE